MVEGVSCCFKGCCMFWEEANWGWTSVRDDLALLKNFPMVTLGRLSICAHMVEIWFWRVHGGS